MEKYLSISKRELIFPKAMTLVHADEHLRVPRKGRKAVTPRAGFLPQAGLVPAG